MQVPQVHRTIRYTNDYPPFILPAGTRIELWREPLHEGMHPDDAFDDRGPDLATVIETVVHQNNCDYILGYVVARDDADVIEDCIKPIKSYHRIVGAYPQEH
jgi:hypothetical protein